MGVFYRAQRLIYHEGLYGDFNPVKQKLTREERIVKIKKFFKP